MDVGLEWWSDFQIDSSGDLFMVDGNKEVRQRLQRRLFTAVNGYVWHPEYGAGLPQKIGVPLTLGDIQSVVRSQLALEASVAPSPPAQLTITQDPNNPAQIDIGIVYWDAVSGTSVSFNITT
jgi:hypothetical protein